VAGKPSSNKPVGGIVVLVGKLVGVEVGVLVSVAVEDDVIVGVGVMVG
jgi:hypothetical protein